MSASSTGPKGVAELRTVDRRGRQASRRFGGAMTAIYWTSRTVRASSVPAQTPERTAFALTLASQGTSAPDDAAFSADDMRAYRQAPAESRPGAGSRG